MKNGKRAAFARFGTTAGMLLLWPFFSFSQDSIPADTAAPRETSRIRVHGYVKDMQTVSFIDDSRSLTTGNLVHNRINFRWDFSEQVYLRLECRNRLFYGEQVKANPFFGELLEQDNGLLDLSYNLVNDTALVFNTTLDRALLGWMNDKWDITVGRQRINWGVNIAWNPNDIFNAFNYFDFDYEERPGTDAIRVQYSTGTFSSLELACKLSGKKEEQVSALMYKTNFKKYDWQYFAGIYNTDIVAGAGWAGNIKNTGFKGEASWFQPYKNITDTHGVLSAAVSFDRSFKNNYFLVASWLYSSAGNSPLTDIRNIQGAGLSAKNLMPFEHSFLIQASKSFNPLLNGSLGSMYSPENNTLIFLPGLALSVSENWDIGLIGQSFFGEVNNTYRALGNAVYLRLRWSY